MSPLRMIDAFLNRIPMYRLVVYVLVGIIAIAALFGATGIIARDPIAILASTAFILGVTWLSNRFFAYGFDAPYNPESTWITGLILALLIAPPNGSVSANYLTLVIASASLAMASKYLLARRRAHLFNPAAFGIAAAALLFGPAATWWVGTPHLIIPTLIGGLLIVRKIRRFSMWSAFTLTYAAGLLISEATLGSVTASGVVSSFSHGFLYAPAFFFASIMLTDPMTMPATRASRVAYSIFAAILFLPDAHIGSYFFTPEVALVAANLFAFLIDLREKQVLTLKDRAALSPDVFEFAFAPERPLRFRPGQYLEWMLPHAHADSRGIRRYFTISSSSKDPLVRLGVKFYDPASSFKRALLLMKPGQQLVVAQRAGDFTLPEDTRVPLIFIAGGIGITPFISMIRDLLDRGEKRTIALFYANKTPADIAYKELLDRAQSDLGITVVYVCDMPTPSMPGRIDASLIARTAPDYRSRMCYISGPQGMVTAFKGVLHGMGIGRTRIKTDYFPGF